MAEESRGRDVPGAALRLLTFRTTREEFLGFDYRHLAFGLVCAWVVGIGRWWDDPGAGLLQHLGFGSVVYVFVLSLLLWLLVWPLRPQRWSYRHVLTFVSLTSPPAILYAVPVERMMGLPAARSVNAWFLAVVAAWRVALLLFYLRRHARLGAFSIVVAALLPVAFIVVTLAALNLERAVFATMGGLRGEATPNDAAYQVLLVLTFLSMVLCVPLVICYIMLCVWSSVRK